MRQERENQQALIIEFLKACPWSSHRKMISGTSVSYPTTIISRIRDRYGYECIEQREVNNDGIRFNEYRLSKAFKAMMEVKVKKVFPTDKVFF